MLISRSFAKTSKVREYRRKAKMVSRYSPSETGESPLNPWFTPEKSKACLQEMQRLRNLHRFTIKYDPKLVEEYIKISEAFSRLQLHKFLKFRTLLLKDRLEQVKACDELEALPKQLQKREETEGQQLDVSSTRYWPQMIHYLPTSLGHNLKVGESLLELVEDRMVS